MKLLIKKRKKNIYMKKIRKTSVQAAESITYSHAFNGSVQATFRPCLHKNHTHEQVDTCAEKYSTRLGSREETSKERSLCDLEAHGLSYRNIDQNENVEEEFID